MSIEIGLFNKQRSTLIDEQFLYRTRGNFKVAEPTDAILIYYSVGLPRIAGYRGIKPMSSQPAIQTITRYVFVRIFIQILVGKALIFN